ncbi:MAG: hypothetical protein ACI4JQ_03055 [Ruminococcus sp.]
MKKVSLILAIAMVLGMAVMAIGCGGSSSSSGKDLFDAKSWDYDGDGKLSGRELDGYADFYQDAYDYAYN